MIKVGDKVRCIRKEYSFTTEGKEYIVEEVGSRPDSFYIRDDDGDRTLFDLTEGFSIDSDELAQLRAWKASALARFPALEEPETDDEAAERFAETSYNEGRMETMLLAFAWARANLR